MTKDADWLSGGIFFLFGLYFAVSALSELQLGTPARMGPGFFPLIVGLLLMGLGIAVALVHGPAGAIRGAVSWRAVVFLTLAPVFFGLAIRGLGFVPTTAISVFLAANAYPETTQLKRAAIAAGLTLFTTVVFLWIVELPFDLFGEWVGG